MIDDYESTLYQLEPSQHVDILMILRKKNLNFLLIIIGVVWTIGNFICEKVVLNKSIDNIDYARVLRFGALGLFFMAPFYY